MLLAAITLIISAFFAFRAVRLHQQNSPFKESFLADSIILDDQDLEEE
jgi:hypothetical protein